MPKENSYARLGSRAFHYIRVSPFPKINIETVTVRIDNEHWSLLGTIQKHLYDDKRLPVLRFGVDGVGDYQANITGFTVKYVPKSQLHNNVSESRTECTFTINQVKKLSINELFNEDIQTAVKGGGKS